MSRTICIYHGNCADGFTAAWVVWQALGNAVEFVPGHYGKPPPDVTGADVIMVDFSYKRPVIDAMAATCRTMLILDHHKTAAADLAGIGMPFTVSGWRAHLEAVHNAFHQLDRDPRAPFAIFDMERSGAQIAWDFFFEISRPLLVDYVGDRDLWKFKLPHSREVAAWVFSFGYDFGQWSALQRGLSVAHGIESIADQGRAILRKHDKDIAELLKVTAREMVIGGMRVPVANLPYTMASDAAHLLAADAPFAACYFDRPDARVFSLRSRDEGADVSLIAAGYGGGGHRSAAGFQKPVGWEGDEVTA